MWIQAHPGSQMSVDKTSISAGTEEYTEGEKKLGEMPVFILTRGEKK